MKQHLNMTTEVSVVRAYNEPDGYANRVPYIGILTISHLTDTVVFIHGALGKITKESHEEVMEMLKGVGVEVVMYERRGRIKTFNLNERQLHEY